MEIDSDRRFQGIQRLYGRRASDRIHSSHVCIIGIGGVGSWAAESLARSNLGELTLIDLDHIAESNINRQIHALTSTLGKAKIEAMAERIRAIDPQCKLNLVDDYLSVENIPDLIHANFSYIIDCIDQFRIKAALIHYCKRNKMKVITTGGAGGRTDPLRIRVADLARAEGDALLSKTRKELRRNYGFPRNLKRRFDVACVYSTETQRYPTSDHEISTTKPECSSVSGLSCADGFGSLSAVTASFGLIAAAQVLNKISSAC